MLMKRFVFCFGLVLISYGAFAQDKEAILKVLDVQRASWNAGNLEDFMQTYWKSDSLLFVGQSGPEYGWQNVLNNYKKSYPDKAAMGILSFDIHEVKFIETGHAFVVGAWHLKREKDASQGFFTLLLKSVNGKWKIIADHSS